MKKVLVGLLTASLLVLGCLSAPGAGKSTEKDMEAKQFTPPAGKANLYIVRPNESSQAQTAFRILVDDKLIAELYPGTYQMVVIDPGKHRIEVKAGGNTARMEANLDADRNAFYQAAADASVRSAPPQLSVILLERMGKLSVNQCRRASILP